MPGDPPQIRNPSPMRITHYLSSVNWSLGGVVRAAVDLAVVLARRGHAVTLLTCDAKDAPQVWLTPGEGHPHVLLLDPPRPPLGLLPGSALKRAEEAIAASDVLHLHGMWETSNVQLSRIARRRWTPYVLTIHGMLDDWSMSQKRPKKLIYLNLAGRRMLDNAAAVHCTATAELEQARQWFRNPRTAVVPCLFNLSEFESLPSAAPALEAFPALRTTLPKLLFLGRLHVKKGVELLLEAAAILQQMQCPALIVIAGSGEAEYEQHLRDYVSRLGLEQSVCFTGLVTGDLKRSLYQAADLFVLPTSQENFGLVFPEAMACGAPVVTTRGVDIWRELEQGGATIVDSNAVALADAIAPLMADAPRRRELAGRGRSWVEQNLDPHRVAQDYEALYDDAAARRAVTGSGG
jgi:glycosyltransferase involved in cell wall biosynthesis